MVKNHHRCFCKKKGDTHVFVGKRSVQSFWETVVGFPGNLLEQNNNN